MKRKITILIVVAGICLLLLFGYTRSRSKAAAASAPPQRGAGQQAVPVSIAAVTQQDMPVYLDGLGSVQAFNTVTIKTRIDGEVTQVAFREGQDVKKGELLIVIDPRPYQVALEQAQATMYRDQSQLTIAKRNVERYSEIVQRRRCLATGFGYAAIGRGEPGGNGSRRPGCHRQCEVEPGVYTHHGSIRRSRRLAAGRSWEHGSCQRYDWHAGADADAPNRRDLHDP